ncbi:putative peroxiredoxin pmp20 [Yarrowia sp. C11]|nr:putative peroxiredoxin pmp20 [Yarrowia sp. E02]KAG5365380.1 putative peroxiredoxin pmp20 [Yarrowia sp. C11]
MFLSRRMPQIARMAGQTSRGFHATAMAALQKGQDVPAVTVREGSPSDQFDLQDMTKEGTHIIVGVPGAFSPTCSAGHIPGYIELMPKFKERGVKAVWVVTVNDTFVTNAWAESLEVPVDEVRMISDFAGEFSLAFGTLFDASAFFGNHRSSRYAAVVMDGKVVEVFEEPDKTGLNVSKAENVLKSLG